jgi:CRP-like cAMP-binding protein
VRDAVSHVEAARRPGPEPGWLPLLASAERSALNDSAWFSALPTTLRHDLLRHGQVRRYREGEAVHAAGLAAVASGAVGVALRKSGEVFQYLPAGSWLVDPAAFLGGERRHSIVAHGRTTILCVSAAALAQEMERHFGLEQALLALSHERLAEQCGILGEVSGSDIRTRLVRCIARLAARFGEAEEGGVRIALDLKQDALADLVRASRARVNLHLKALEREGVLQVERQLLVRDAARLAALA